MTIDHYAKVVLTLITGLLFLIVMDRVQAQFGRPAPASARVSAYRTYRVEARPSTPAGWDRLLATAAHERWDVAVAVAPSDLPVVLLKR